MALFVFTGHQLKEWNGIGKVVFFLVMEHALLSLKWFIAAVIPDVPDDVQEQQVTGGGGGGVKWHSKGSVRD